jgi:hypothetical protein
MVTDTHVVVSDTQTVVVDTRVAVADAQKVITDTQKAVAGTHTVVADTHTMVADIHRSVLTGREGTSGKNHPVGATWHMSTTECLPSSRPVNPLHRPPGTVSGVTSWLRRLSDSPKASKPSLSSVQGGSGRRLSLSPSSTTIESKIDLAITDDLFAAISFPLRTLISSPDSPRSLVRGFKILRT